MSTVLAFIVVLGILIFVHELGHFLMARRQGVKVEVFSLGFGPKLVGFVRGETEYRISAIPLGGYVKMAGEQVEGEQPLQPHDFMAQPVASRAKIILAGPLMNILLALVLMPLVYLMGIEVPDYWEQPPVAGWVEEDSPAEQAGFQPGDRILRVDGKPVPTWEAFARTIATNPGKTLVVEVMRDGVRRRLTLTPRARADTGAGTIGLYHPWPPIVGRVLPGYPAEQAGLKPGDRIVALNGVPMRHWIQLPRMVQEAGERPLTLDIERDGKRFQVTLTPKKVKPQQSPSGWRTWLRRVLGKPEPSQPQERPLVGLAPHEPRHLKRFGPLEALWEGTRRIAHVTVMTFVTIKKLVTLDLSIKALGGPIMIAQVTGTAAQTGVPETLSFMAIISHQLGILNLLPIPVLDGGWLVFLLLEAIKGRPLSRRALEIAQSLGFAFLIALIAVVSYNDVMRFLLQ